MQYVEGRTLESVLQEKGKLSPREVISVAKRVLDTEMISYKVTELELQRNKRAFQSTRARMLLTYQLKPPKGDISLTVPNRELNWIRRPGGWFLTRSAR